MEQGESIVQTDARETYEETGIILDPACPKVTHAQEEERQARRAEL